MMENGENGGKKNPLTREAFVWQIEYLQRAKTLRIQLLKTSEMNHNRDMGIFAKGTKR